MASIDRVIALSEEYKKKKKNKDYEIQNSLINVKDIANDIKKKGTATSFKNYQDSNDIAPTKKNYAGDISKTSTLKDKEKNTWFSKGAFSDNKGNVVTDTISTILGTVGDVGLNAVHGIGSLAEGVADLISYGIAGAADVIGQDDYADNVRTNTKEDTVGGWLKPAEDFLDDYSVIGEKGDQISQGLGQVGGIILTGGLGAAGGLGAGGVTALTTGTTFASSMGSGMSEAYQSGATDAEATTYGAIKGAGDAVTELIFAGLGKGINAVGFSKGLSSADDMLAKKLSSKINNQIAKNFVQYGVKAGAEGSEEVLAGLVSAAGKKLTYMSEEELSQLVEDENLLEQFVMGAVTSGVAQSGIVPGMTQGSLIETNKTGRDFITGYTQNEQTVIDSLVNEQSNELSKQKAIENTIKEAITARETEQGGTLSAKEKTALTEGIKAKIEAGEIDVSNTKLTNKEISKIRQEVEDSLNQGLLDTNKIESILGNTITEQDNVLAKSYQETAKRSQNFTYDDTKITNEQEKAVYDSAAKYFNDTTRSHEFVEKVAKIAKDKGTNYGFINNEELKSLGHDVEGKQVNGLVRTNKDGKQTVLINIDSPKALNTIVGHETTHLLEGTTEYQELQEAIFNYAKEKGDFDSRQKILNSLYEGIENANVDSELTADLVGDYLFTDEKFIDSLSVQKPTVFQKIKELIDDLIVKFTGTKEEQQLREVQKKFREAYKKNVASKEISTQYSMIGKKSIDRLAKNDSSYQILIDKYNQALQMKEEGKTNKEIWKKTLWIQDEEGKWKFEISDNEAELNNKPEKNKKYKLENIFKHEDLYEAYPESKNITVKFKNIKDNVDPKTGKRNIIAGYYNPLTGTISLNNKLLEMNNGEKHIINTILHEVQHKIQKYEGFNYGYKGKDVEGYFKNLGEIEAKDTERRRILSYVERSQIAPVSLFEENSNLLYNNTNGGNINEANQKNKTILSKSLYDADERSINDRRGSQSNVEEIENPYYIDEELDNSSFFDAKYSLTDNQGRTLTKEQQEYFKDSKVRDKKGKLEVMYRGDTGEAINVFDKNKSKKSNLYGTGFYFADENMASLYGNTTPYYLNIVNPLYVNEDTHNITKEQYSKFIKLAMENEDYSFENYGNMSADELINKLYDGRSDFKLINDVVATAMGDYRDAFDVFEKANGIKYDGIISNSQTVAFESNQIKNIDNTNPTSDADIRYSLSEADLKQKQLDIILENNPVEDDYHTWIRSIDDIKTFEETLQDDDWADYIEEGFNPDYTGDMVKEAQETGKITVYSSYPIEQGIFVSPSRMEVESYSGNGKIYSKEVNLKDVAWIDPTQGQYAKVEIGDYSLSNPNEQIAPTGDYNVYGEDVKLAIAPLQEEIQALTETVNDLKGQTDDIPTNATEWKERAKKRSVEQKVEDMIQKHSYRNAVSTSMLGRKLLDFNESERRTFRDSLIELTSKTRNKLTNADDYNNVRNIIKQYADREYNFIDEDLAAAKRDVRKYRIKFDEEVKRQITDAEYFRKSNFGNLTLARDGMSIDSVWQELNSMYPYYFSEDITTEADMLYALSDFMQQDVTITEKYRISDNEIENITAKIYNKIIHNALTTEDLEFAEQDITTKVERRNRQVVQDELLREMGITKEVLDGAKKINQIDLMRTDPIRVNEKIFGWENGQIINDATIRTTIKHEAERIRFLNQERDDIKSLGIKARSKESAAVQKYGEKQYVNKYGELVPYGDKELIAEFSDIETQNKIKRAAQIIRNKYDAYIEIVNNELERMGYDPIPKRNDYMRHFQEMTDIFSKLGTPLNPTSLNENNLPTDINGLTDEFKPGKSWFANAQHRKGLKTVYDAITGIDGYLDSVSNVIYHTEDIQRYRTLAKFIRNTYSEKILEDYDVLRDEERIEAFDKAYKGQNGYLSQYVAWLDEQANALAGKKGKIDRGFEEFFGRKAYSVLNDTKKQVGSNMTGLNVRSALTNFASVVQGLSKTKKIPFAKGLYSTFNNIVQNDGLIDKSDFLTTRFGSEQLSKKLWQKASNYGQIFMTGTDYFTANLIWRSKYFENIRSGMDENTAIKNADDFAARIMGNRAKGTTAQVFNSKTLGLFTQFQLEANNYWSNVIHDNKMEIEKGQIEDKTGKAVGSVIFNLGQLAVFSNIFNSVMKSLTGSDVMFDSIELLKDLIGGDDDEEETTLMDKVGKAIGKITDDVPFIGVLTGKDRIPVTEAFSGLAAPYKAFTKEDDEYGQEYTWEKAWKEFFDSAAYWVMPTGYGQLKKTTKGLLMFDDDLPIAGSYTDSGNLRFTVDDDLPSKIKSGLFGQYSNEEAQEYIDSGFKTIHKNSIEELVDLNMKSSEYRNLKADINKAGKKNKEKVDYIANLDELTNDQKNILVNNILDRKEEVDVSNYDDFGSYEEFDFAIKNKEKYEWLTQNDIPYKDYIASDESKEAYNWAYNNPEKYAVSKAIADDVVTYKQYTSEMNDISADKNNEGKSISGSRKNKVISYVNSLDLSIPQKAMLIRQEYSTFNEYNNDIVEYVSSLNIAYEEKVSILEELDMKVLDDGIVRWGD